MGPKFGYCMQLGYYYRVKKRLKENKKQIRGSTTWKKLECFDFKVRSMGEPGHFNLPNNPF
jgi:hypothetical protein